MKDPSYDANTPAVNCMATYGISDIRAFAPYPEVGDYTAVVASEPPK